MNKKFTKLMAAIALLVFMAPSLAGWGQTKITDCADIVSGTTYYIGATVSNIDYYLSVSHDQAASVKGTGVTSTDNATTFLFEGSNNSWTIQFDNGFYVGALTNTNAEIVVAASGATFTTSNTNNNLIKLQNGNRYIQKNSSSSLNFGSYNGNQMHIWLIEVPTGPIQLEAPTLTATPGNEKVTLEWANVNHSSSYSIQYADNASFTGASTITNVTSPKEISGLTNGTTYYFKAMSVGDGTDYLSSDYGTVVSSTPSNLVTITITQDEIDGFTNAYDWYDWSVGDISGKLYAYKSGGMQFNSSKTAYWIYNSTAIPGNITSVKMTKASGTDRLWTLKAGTSALTTTNSGTQIGNALTVGTNGATWDVSGNYNYFLLYVSGGSTVISSIEITYEPSTDPIISANPVTLEHGATSGTINYSVTNPVDGASVVATTSASWISSSFTYGTNSVTFSVTEQNFAAENREGTITLTYGDNLATKDVTIIQEPAPTPSITADNVSIAYNDEEGYIAYSISDPVEGGTIAASCNSDWLLVESTAGENGFYFTCDANPSFTERTATVTLTYTYTQVASTVTKEVIVTQAGNPNAFDNISAITGASSYHVKGEVVATSSKGFVIGDGTGYVYTYMGNTSFDYEVGNKLSITGTTSTNYGHVIQFTSAATIGTVTETNYNGNPQPTAITEVPDYSQGSYLSTYLQFEGELTKDGSNYFIAVGNSQIQISYPSTAQGNALTALNGKLVRVKGYFTGINSSSKFSVMLESVEEVLHPSITVANTAINVGFEGIIDTLSVTYNNITEVVAEVQFCDANGNAATYDWIIASIIAENNVEYTVEENEGEARSAYFRVYALDDNGEDVYSDIVTVTQSAMPQRYTLTVSDLSHVNLFVFGGEESETIIDTELGENTAQVINGTEILVSVNVEEGYVLQSLSVMNEATEEPIELTEIGEDYYSFTMPESDVTITATAVKAPQPAKYVLATSVVSGRHYIITNGTNKAMGSQSSNNRKAVDITIADGMATGNANVYEFVISTDATNSEWFNIYDGVNEGYLYAAGGSTGSNNHLKVQNELTDNGRWTIEIDQDGVATITAQGDANRNIMRYNSSSTIFSCYASGQQNIYLYERVYTMNIAAHGDNDNPSGWYLIASPVDDDITPSISNGFITENEEDFDLYRFNQSVEKEWENWKSQENNGDHYHFNLVSGKGYLYASKNGTTLTFTGTPYSGDGVFELDYSTDNPDANMRGWNLVGNPFNANVIVDKEFYEMNEDGSEIVAATESSIIEPMEGIFVQATEEGQTVTFIPATEGANAGSKPALAMNLSQNRGSVIDRAIIRFGESSTLPKLQLFESNTKLYIPQNGKDYAIVSAEAQGEMPVNFRAAKNGTYTLSINPEGVEMNYLHLIDNMTGADVDLLATPSYTFNATTRDYESRFRLVFAANNEDGVSTGSTAFAFYSNGTWVINNIGEATLQVVDVNGRILSSETVNGSVSKAINAPAGVYMLRLINGNDVKTQKIVVR